jgi:hypothetical protein
MACHHPSPKVPAISPYPIKSNICSQPSETLEAFTVSKPACLDTPVRNDLKADARMVDLRGLNPNFFAFGAMNLEIWPDDEELMDVLVEVRVSQPGRGS